MKNIELFNLAVGEILGECYSKFPIPAYISKGLIGLKVRDYYPQDEPNLIDMGDPEFEVTISTIRWLAQADYIWLIEGDLKKSRQFKATLSPKGLELLNAIPDSIEKKESVGSMLAKGVTEVGVASISALVSQVLAKGAGFG